MMTLQYLSDRLEIDDLLTRYASALDDKDWDRWASCFTPDADLDYTAAGGVAGKLPEVRAWLEQVIPGFPMTHHLVTNKEVRIDGDRATCRSSLINPMGVPDGETLMVFLETGHYHDEMVRTADGWRISKRVEKPTFSTRKHRLMMKKPFEV